jgi:hypothetical protein
MRVRVTRGVALTAGWQLCMVACAPSQTFRPAGSIPSGRTEEVGLAVSSVEPRPYVNESTQRLGQAWWTLQFRERWSVTALAAFDTSAALGGVAMRWDAFQSSRFALSTELQLGFVWAAASASASVRLWPGGLIYTSPRLGNWGSEVTPFLPVGLAAEIIEGTVVRAEMQVSWSDFQYYNRRIHWGVAVAHQW